MDFSETVESGNFYCSCLVVVAPVPVAVAVAVLQLLTTCFELLFWFKYCQPFRNIRSSQWFKIQHLILQKQQPNTGPLAWCLHANSKLRICKSMQQNISNLLLMPPRNYLSCFSKMNLYLYLYFYLSLLELNKTRLRNGRQIVVFIATSLNGIDEAKTATTSVWQPKFNWRLERRSQIYGVSSLEWELR